MDPNEHWYAKELNDLQVKLAETNGRIDTMGADMKNIKERLGAGVSTAQWIIGLILVMLSNLGAALLLRGASR